MYLADYHVHSSCSPDGHVTMAELAREAIDRGLDELCFTDHVESVLWCTTTVRTEDHDWKPLQAQYQDAVAQYGHRIRLKLGIELGESNFSFPAADRILDTAPGLDFVIGSVHMARDENGWFDLFDIDGSRDDGYYHRVVDSYLETVLQVAHWGRCSVLGHLTLPVRCINEMQGRDISFRPHMAQVEEILRTIIPRGVGLECNTNRGKTPLPDGDILRLYRELGGEVITLGSDTHTTGFLGCAIAQRQELLRQCGFRYFTTFDGGQPVFRPL